MNKSEYVNINFSKNKVISSYKKNDNKEMSIISFPKKSKWFGYVWHIPTDLLKESKFNENDYFTGMKRNFQIMITKSEKDQEGNWISKDKIIITAEDLAEQYTKNKSNE